MPDVWESLPTFIEKYSANMEGFEPDKWPKLFCDFKNSLDIN